MNGSIDVDKAFVGAGVAAFVEAAAEMGLSQADSVVAQVESWFCFYRSWVGRRVVGFSEAAEIAVKLIADSFAITKAVPSPVGSQPLSVIDLGSGNGWPGLAARFSWAGSSLTLLDSRLGACEFIEQYVDFASLERVTVAPFRAEDAAKMVEFRGHFGLVTTRAMAQPGVALELSIPFAAPGGLVGLWLGPENAESALKRPEVPELGVSRVQVHGYRLAGGKGRRILVVYRRDASPSKGYPRSLSSIKARPLL